MEGPPSCNTCLEPHKTFVTLIWVREKEEGPPPSPPYIILQQWVDLTTLSSTYLTSCHDMEEDQQEVCHTVTLPIYFFFKKYLKAKEELWKLKIISPCKNTIFLKKKNPLKENQNPSRYYYYNSVTNLKFQLKPKYHVSKILI